MKNILYGIIALAVIGVCGMTGYFLYNKIEKDNIEFNQKQQNLCEEKYKKEFEGTGYTWIDGAEEWTNKEVIIKYSDKEKACFERFMYTSKIDGEYYRQIEIKNLDNGVSYFDCSQNGDELAECSIGCSKRKQKSCVGDISSDDEDYLLHMIDSDYIKISRKLGLITDEEIEQMKTYNELIKEESESKN